MRKRDRTAPTSASVTEGHRGIVMVHASRESARQDSMDPEALFRAGLRLLQRNQGYGEAAFALERAYQSRPSDPRYASYYGLSLALASNRLKEAEALCSHAIKIDFCRSDLFHNLGRVRLLLNDRKGAYSAFQKGLSVDRNDARIQRELAKLGVRQPPVIRSLGRRHPLNKYLGMLLSQLGRGRCRS